MFLKVSKKWNKEYSKKTNWSLKHFGTKSFIENEIKWFLIFPFKADVWEDKDLKPTFPETFFDQGNKNIVRTKNDIADRNIFKVSNEDTGVLWLTFSFLIQHVSFAYDQTNQPLNKPDLFNFNMRKKNFVYKLYYYNEQNIRVYDKQKSTQIVGFELFGSSFSPQFVDEMLGLNKFNKPYLYNKQSLNFEYIQFPEIENSFWKNFKFQTKKTKIFIFFRMILILKFQLKIYICIKRKFYFQFFFV